MTRVGITRTAKYLPPGRMTSEMLAARSGLEIEKIHQDLGMHEKPVGGPGESALDHALKAGLALLEGLDPASIDLLIYCSGSMPDHLLSWGIYKLHEQLGLKNARFLELHFGCIGSLHALEAARNYMVADPRMNRAIVIGAEGYHFSEVFADYANPANEPMYIFGDGAAAALLESDRAAPLPNTLGAFKFLVDSSHFADVPIPAGGARLFPTAETVAQNLHALQLPVKDPKDLKRFGLQYIRNYLAVIEGSLSDSGRPGKPDFLIPSQLKLPLMNILLRKLGLTMDDTVYTMPHWGHIGTADILLVLDGMLSQGKLKPGSTGVIVSSGVSFSWGAATLHVS